MNTSESLNFTVIMIQKAGMHLGGTQKKEGTWYFFKYILVLSSKIVGKNILFAQFQWAFSINFLALTLITTSA